MAQSLCASITAVALTCDPSPADRSALPWVHGLMGAQVATSPIPTGEQQMQQFRADPEGADEACAPGAATVLELHADVAPPAGDETILASMTDGIVVLDASGELIARSPGYPCAGSVHELEVLATGAAGFLDPTIAIVASSGGHRERIAWLGLFRVGTDGRIDPTFTGTVEDYPDTVTRRGSVTLLPGALLYRRPGGPTSLWVFDPVARAYVPSDRRDHPSHDREPPVAIRAADPAAR